MDYRLIEYHKINPSRIASGAFKSIFLKPTERTKNRRKVCEGCPKRIDSSVDSIGQCSECGCKLNWKTSEENESCPLNKWMDIQRTKKEGGIAILNVDIQEFFIEKLENKNVFILYTDNFHLKAPLHFINENPELLAIVKVETKGCSTDLKAGYVSGKSKKIFKIDSLTDGAELIVETKINKTIENKILEQSDDFIIKIKKFGNNSTN